jgi:hypothetical protein
MSFGSSNLLFFAVDLVLWNKKKSGSDKLEEYESDLIMESLILSKIASFIPNEFYKPNETILPHNIPCSQPDFIEQILCE